MNVDVAVNDNSDLFIFQQMTNCGMNSMASNLKLRPVETHQTAHL